MASRSELSAEMEAVEEGHIVLWNGRTNPQVVTAVTDSWFEVRSHRGSSYRFHPGERYLVNRQSGTRYAVTEFEIVGEAYDVDAW